MKVHFSTKKGSSMEMEKLNHDDTNKSQTTSSQMESGDSNLTTNFTYKKMNHTVRVFRTIHSKNVKCTIHIVALLAQALGDT